MSYVTLLNIKNFLSYRNLSVNENKMKIILFSAYHCHDNYQINIILNYGILEQVNETKYLV